MNGKTFPSALVITSGDMTTTLSSTPIYTQYNDNVGIQAVWTGSPVGVITVQVSLDPFIDGKPPVNWSVLPASAFTGTYPVPGTTGSPGFLDIPLTAAAWVQVVYTPASGSGSLNVRLTSKGI